ncbi:MAG TPA: DUF4317 domain-containing protein [Firmicutes bacterium]|nr:DUF4317 domain-containing protein [Bacillota bacterium]
MNEKEVAEIRRRFRPDKSNITHVRGCYVNEQREIVSQFDQSIALMPQEEAEKMLATLRRTLSGTLGKNLVDIVFSTKQVLDSEEHRLLTALRGSRLEDAAAVETLYRKVIETTPIQGQYLILLAYDTYDVPYRSRDGEEQADASSEVFSYILCSLCPVKPAKPSLCYDVPENLFRSVRADWLVSPPELGFLFPAFDDRSANIYSALYYTRDTAENHPAFVDAVFRTPVPPPAEEQKQAFQSVLGGALEDECSYEVVQAVRDQMCAMIEEHKAGGDTEPLTVSKRTVQGVLEACGVSEERVAAFEQQYDEAFGGETEVRPRNIVDTRRIEVRTPDVTIQVNPERSDLIETKVINGAKYILIRAEGGVEVNGVNIRIT